MRTELPIVWAAVCSGLSRSDYREMQPEEFTLITKMWESNGVPRQDELGTKVAAELAAMPLGQLAQVVVRAGICAPDRSRVVAGELRKMLAAKGVTPGRVVDAFIHPINSTAEHLLAAKPLDEDGNDWTQVINLGRLHFAYWLCWKAAPAIQQLVGGRPTASLLVEELSKPVLEGLWIAAHAVFQAANDQTVVVGSCVVPAPAPADDAAEVVPSAPAELTDQDYYYALLSVCGILGKVELGNQREMVAGIFMRVTGSVRATGGDEERPMIVLQHIALDSAFASSFTVVVGPGVEPKIKQGDQLSIIRCSSWQRVYEKAVAAGYPVPQVG